MDFMSLSMLILLMIPGLCVYMHVRVRVRVCVCVCVSVTHAHGTEFKRNKWLLSEKQVSLFPKCQGLVSAWPQDFLHLSCRAPLLPPAVGPSVTLLSELWLPPQ